MANEDILNVIEEAIGAYRPTGEFAKARAEQLATKKATVIPKMYSGLVSSGLGGTTVKQTIPTRFEQEIAQPFETETELLRTQRLMESIMAKAGIMESEAQRTFEAEQAEEERKLREKLAAGEITSNEYLAEQQRLSNEYIANLTARSRTGGTAGAGGGGGETIPWRYSGTTPVEEDTGGYGSSYSGGYSGPEWNPDITGKIYGPDNELLYDPETGYQAALENIYGNYLSGGKGTLSQKGNRLWYQYAPGEYQPGMPFVAGAGGYWVK